MQGKERIPFEMFFQLNQRFALIKLWVNVVLSVEKS